jgi:hypothetical protein
MGFANRYLRVGFLSFLIALILTLAVSAHEVGIRANIEVRSASGGVITYSQENLPSNAQIASVIVTVIYSTQEPMANGQIQIYAPGMSDTPWRTGQLDENGRYRFSPDLSRRGRWTIRVQSEGHTNFMNLVI